MLETFIHKIRKNPYWYFFFKLIAFLLLLFVLDFSIGNILRHFYFKQQSGLQYRTTYSIEKTNADILVFGSSRANHHYRPDAFENQIGLSFYNVGRDGQYVFYHLDVLKAVLKRYTPKIIILDFVNKEFAQNQESYDRLSVLLPYYKTHPEMRSIINLRSKYERLKLLSQIYPFNSTMFTIAVGNAEFNKKRKSDNKGYVPLTRKWNGVIPKNSISANYEVDSLKIDAYKSFIQECARANVKLYIVCSPYFIQSDITDYSVSIGKEIAKENNIAFFDFSKDTVFVNNTELFADFAHLNDTGAKLFSDSLVKCIIEK
ncbi:MAG: hypothetical protein JNK36_02035 [Bacteroidia bacterium]|nr:hypothetical protein [Bacteroidia bacterium]MBP7714075.1 hypothetical protein [Bacteroidia bacterium]MBP8668443.1 hypothetical protein [Bacteroidia bacterium]HQW17127.1 hypothetical protein [Bacteroidia bacterium]HQW50016.1 hypothetical protein [Bacteroidia bacterium]